MTVFQSRWPKAALILAGQSLWINPSGTDSVATKIATGRDVTTYIAYRSGFAWTQFVTIPNLLLNVTRNADAAPKSILVMMGGTTDIAVGGPGATCYSNEVSVSQTFKAAGGTYVIGTTTTPSTVFTAPQNVQLAALNAAVMADASGAFDSKVDLAANANLSDPANTTYYADGTHPTPAGATIIANLLGAAVDLLIA